MTEEPVTSDAAPEANTNNPPKKKFLTPPDIKKLTEKQEAIAYKIGGIATIAIALMTGIAMIVLMRVTDEDSLRLYVQVALFLIGFIASLAALMRVWAHQRSTWIDYWGKGLGAWAAALTVLALALRGFVSSL